MRTEIKNDNLYPEGIIIYAKMQPTVALLINKYKQHIYYCSVAAHPNQNNLAYFESELIPPNSLNGDVKLSRIDHAPATDEKQSTGDHLSEHQESK